MKPHEMRLRLVVRRHSLPETRIIFTVPLDNDPTISHFIELVNGLIPLESEDWGLEDYVVELHDAEGHAFDCLHFQRVAAVLKPDEEVFIRPLLTGDRKKRRLSGRDQISSDGKHLIDGVAFGYPRLKAPRQRPPVAIPPLKRRRITYAAQEDGEEEDELDDQEPPQLLPERNGSNSVRFHLTGHDQGKSDWATSLVRYEDQEEGEDEDDDFVGDNLDDADDADFMEDESLGSPDSELEDELRDLQTENEQLGETVSEQEPQHLGPDTSAWDGPIPNQGQSLTLVDLDRITALRAAFPTASVDICEKTLIACGRKEKTAYKKLQRNHQAKMTSRDMVAYFDTLRNKGPDVDDDDQSDASEAESVDSIVKHYDKHGFPSGSILAGTASTHMAESLRKSGQLVKLPVHTRLDDSEDEENTQDTTKSVQNIERGLDSGDSSSSDSDSAPEVQSSKQPIGDTGVASNDSSSDSDSSSSDDSDGDSSSASDSPSDSDDDDSGSDDHDEDEDSDEDDDGSFGGLKDDDSDESASSDDSSSSEDSSDSEEASNSGVRLPPDSKQSPNSKKASGSKASPSAPAEDMTPVRPGNGRSATQRRNARRRACNKAKRLARLGTSSGEIVGNNSTPAATPTGLNADRAPAAVAQVPDMDNTDQASSKADALAARKAELLASLESLGIISGISADPPSATSDSLGAPPATSDVGAAAPPQLHPDFSNRKSKLDVSAGRRMVFGSLGLKNPKNKADEEEIRQKLMENVRPLVNPRVDNLETGLESGLENGQHEIDVEEDPEAWREKITYRAVECCEDNIELSEPPFPFYQRWDPQQRSQARASKRKQRDNANFNEPSRTNKKRRVGYEGGFEDESYMSAAYTDNADVVLNYDDEVEPSTEDQPAMVLDQSEEVEEDDLPLPPSDLSTLPLLGVGQARPGMILTWKQWLLSGATNWQPQVLSLTGAVVHVHDDGSLRLLLAKRDRMLDQNEKQYDEEGNRVYDKFEVPGMDDEAEEGFELGYRTVDLMDMVEPRILQQAGRDGPSPSPSSQQDTSALEPQTNESNLAVIEDGSTKSSSGDLSTTIDHSERVRYPEKHDPSEFDTQQTGESMIPETNPESVSEHQSAQLSFDEDVSMTEDRRREFSLLINDAGFRKELDPSIAQEEPPRSSSPSRQLEETFQQAASASFSEAPPALSASPDVPQGVSQVSQNPSQPSGNSFMSTDSQPIILEPFRGFSDAIDEPADDRVDYPVLDLPPSDIGSTDSGRQPNPDFSIKLGNESPERVGSVVYESGAGHRSPSTLFKREKKAKPVSPAKSTSSISSFPSLSEMCLTASTNGTRATPSQTSVTSAMKTRKSDAAFDPDYEAAMRQLDDEHGFSSGSDGYPPKKRIKKSPDSARELLQRLIGKPTLKRTLKQEPGGTMSTSSPKIQLPKKTTVKRNSTFSVPKGSQVVSLISSSPEPDLEENYAEDSVDETYFDHDAPPSESSDWEKSSKTRRSGSMPVSALSVSKRGNIPKRLVSSQGGKLGRGVSVGQKQTKKKTTVRGYSY